MKTHATDQNRYCGELIAADEPALNSSGGISLFKFLIGAT